MWVDLRGPDREGGQGRQGGKASDRQTARSTERILAAPAYRGVS